MVGQEVGGGGKVTRHPATVVSINPRHVHVMSPYHLVNRAHRRAEPSEPGMVAAYNHMPKLRKHQRVGASRTDVSDCTSLMHIATLVPQYRMELGMASALQLMRPITCWGGDG